MVIMMLEEFDNMSKIKQIDYFEMKNKSTNPHKKSKIRGVGINDSDFKTNENIEGKTRQHPAYRLWVSVIMRCYSEDFHKLYPTYAGCTVCEDWKLFSNFNKWYKENYKEGYHLDKDILFPGNKLYSPRTCLFVPRWINVFVTDSNKTRGEYKIGVYFNKQVAKFEARCNLDDKRVYLGLFNNEDDTHRAWLDYKFKQLIDNKQTIDDIDPRLYSALTNKVLSLK